MGRSDLPARGVAGLRVDAVLATAGFRVVVDRRAPAAVPDAGLTVVAGVRVAARLRLVAGLPVVGGLRVVAGLRAVAGSRVTGALVDARLVDVAAELRARTRTADVFTGEMA